MMQTMAGSGNDWTYIYTADDERIWAVEARNPTTWNETFTLRDLEANDPRATYRTSLRMVVEPESGVILRRRADAGRSELVPPLSAIGRKGTQMTSITRGVDSEGTTFFVHMKGMNGLNVFNTLGWIDLSVDLRVSPDGTVEAKSLSTKLYPSLEGFSYEIIDGELVITPLFRFEETEPDALNGPKYLIFTTWE